MKFETEMKIRLSLFIFTWLMIIGIIFAFFIITSSHSYEIKDTVYVAPTPDSITVTMSMEEWEEYLYWFAPDSGNSIDWDVDTLLLHKIQAREL